MGKKAITRFRILSKIRKRKQDKSELNVIPTKSLLDSNKRKSEPNAAVEVLESPAKKTREDDESSSDTDDNEEAQDAKEDSKSKLFEHVLSQRVNIRDAEEDHESSDHDTEEEDGDGEKNQQLLSALNKVFHPEAKNLGFELLNEKRQTIARNEFEKVDAAPTIELKDLISTLKDEEHNDARLAVSLQENLQSLDMIATQKQLGQVFQAMEDTALELQERRAARDFVDAEMDKWRDITQHLETARTIPLVSEDYSKREKMEHLQHKPVKSLDQFDRSLEQKLREKGLAQPVHHDFDVLQKEDPKTIRQKLIARTREIAQHRSRIAIENAKLARLKKIKSKTYRKLLKNDKEKQEQLENLDEETLQERLEEAEKEFIKERVTLRHKNKSKWVKRAMQFSQYSTSLRQSISEQLQVGDQIKKRQMHLRKTADDFEEETISESLVNHDEGALEKLKASIENQPHTVEQEKGLFAMKFMKVAKEKKIKQQKEILDEIQEDLSAAQKLDDEDNAQRDDAAITATPKPSIVSSGRRIFQAPSNGSLKVNEANNDEDTNIQLLPNSLVVQQNSKVIGVDKAISIENADNLTLSVQESVSCATVPNSKDLSEFVQPKPVKTSTIPSPVITKITKSRKRIERSGINPWLQRDDDTKDDRLSKKQKKDMAHDESEMRLKVESATITENKQGKGTPKEDNSVQDIFLNEVKKQAFASDDLELQFRTAKETAIDKEIAYPDLSSAKLPGWGAWAGKGTNYQETILSQQQKINDIRQLIRSEKTKERADRNMTNVIIRASAAIPEKYLKPAFNIGEAKILDNTVAHPLGSEWNSTLGFKRAVRPRVEKKSGVIIKPLSTKTFNQTSSMRPRDILQNRRQLAIEQDEKRDQLEKERAQRQVNRMKTDLEKEKATQRQIEWDRKMQVI